MSLTAHRSGSSREATRVMRQDRREIRNRSVRNYRPSRAYGSYFEAETVPRDVTQGHTPHRRCDGSGR